MTPRRGAALAVVVIAAALTGCTANSSPEPAPPTHVTAPATTEAATPTPEPTQPSETAAAAELPPLDVPKQFVPGELARDVGTPPESGAVVSATAHGDTEYSVLVRCVAEPGAETATARYEVLVDDEFVSGGTFDCTGTSLLNDVGDVRGGAVQVDVRRSDPDRTAAYAVIAPGNELLALDDRE